MPKTKTNSRKRFWAPFTPKKGLIASIIIVFAGFGGFLIYRSYAASYPVWRGIPNPPRAQDISIASNNCKKILVIGDSIARGMASKDDSPAQDGKRLEAQMKQLGYCTTVYNEAISGSSACQWNSPNIPWNFTNALNKHADADFVVAHFVGNQPGCVSSSGQPLTWTSPGFAWTIAYREAVTSLQAKANTANKPMYWVIPAPAYYRCGADNFVTAVYKNWANWLKNNFVPADKQIDARTPFGGDTYIPSFRFSNGLVGTVRTDKSKLKTPDCLHFTNLGYNYMANAVRSVVAREWQ